MPRIALLTPAADNPYVRTWRPAFDRLAGALEAAGLTVTPRDWREADGAGVDAVLPLLAWGYHQQVDDWLAMLDRLDAAGARVLNPTALLRWNTRKTYLGELEEAGVPTVPTIFVARLTQGLVDDARRLLGVDELVVKPQVSAGSHLTLRLAVGQTLEGGPVGPAMIQPYLSAVEGEGEISLIHFDGLFSHAVGKVAREGDFRVQPQFGGRIGPLAPSAEALEVAAATLAVMDVTPTYARIDLIRGLDGALRLMELEAIEPDLFLEHAPDAGAAFAAAVKRAVG